VRFAVTAAGFLTATVLGCGADDAGTVIDPRVGSAINSVANNPEIPPSWTEFIRAAAHAGIITAPKDIDPVMQAYQGACMDYAITDELGIAQTGDEEIRTTLNEQNRLAVTAEQFDQIKPALDKMCAQMKHDQPR
jgi:hypothetical protein